MINVVSSPGSGKTTLVEKTIRLLLERGYKVATLVGDLATDNDAQRLAMAVRRLSRLNGGQLPPRSRHDPEIRR